MKPHKHAEAIKAWADGAIIECKINDFDTWSVVNWPKWDIGYQYRVKPEPKPDVTMVMFASPFIKTNEWCNYNNNLRLTFDGETMQLKAAEVLK